MARVGFRKNFVKDHLGLRGLSAVHEASSHQNLGGKARSAFGIEGKCGEAIEIGLGIFQVEMFRYVQSLLQEGIAGPYFVGEVSGVKVLHQRLERLIAGI